MKELENYYKAVALNTVFDNYKINAQCIAHTKIRNTSLYDIKLGNGTKIKTISNFAKEIALGIKSQTIPTIKIVPEKGIIRLEILNNEPQKIPFYSKGETPKGYNIPIYLGSSIEENDMWIDLSKNPHTLIAGCTGSGKSTLLHTIIANCIDNNCHIFILDSKNIEYKNYSKCNISLSSSYTSSLATLKFIHNEMEKRYSDVNVDENIFWYKPIVLIIDEFADLIMQDTDNKLFNLLLSLCQKCRAANIFCVLATQRPSTDILNGAIKANFPARISCKVASSIDSRIILDASGAEKLIGNGDAIINNYKYSYQRFQSAFTTSEDVLKHNGY